jgi:hypothetical protein
VIGKKMTITSEIVEQLFLCVREIRGWERARERIKIKGLHGVSSEGGADSCLLVVRVTKLDWRTTAD